MKNNLIGIAGKIGNGKDTVGQILQYLSDEYAHKDGLSYGEWLEECNLIDIRHNRNASPYTIKKYADKLKDIVCILIGCTREQLEDREFKNKELGEEWWMYESNIFESCSYLENKDNVNESYYITKLTPRKLLQLLGTRHCRQIIHPNIWENALFNEYRPLDPHNVISSLVLDYSKCKFPNWIITDVKRPNQAKAIKDRGGIVIDVTREGNFLKDPEDYSKGLGCDEDGLRSLVERAFDAEPSSETALDDYEFDHVIENNGNIEELVEKVKSLNLV